MFGKGKETVFDETYRKAWKIFPSDEHKFIVDLQDLSTLEAIHKSLNLDPDSRLVAKFYAVNGYDEGCFFKPHIDSKKMFQSRLLLLSMTSRLPLCDPCTSCFSNTTKWFVLTANTCTQLGRPSRLLKELMEHCFELGKKLAIVYILGNVKNSIPCFLWMTWMSVISLLELTTLVTLRALSNLSVLNSESSLTPFITIEKEPSTTTTASFQSVVELTGELFLQDGQFGNQEAIMRRYGTASIILTPVSLSGDYPKKWWDELKDVGNPQGL